MFIAALFTIARTWKQPRCPSTDEWIKKLWYIYTMEYFLLLLFSHSVVSDSVTPGNAACQAFLSFIMFQSLLKFKSIESMIPSNHLISCRPLLYLPSIFYSIRVFSKETVLCIRWPKDWSFRFTISPSNEYSGLISFRMD